MVRSHTLSSRATRSRRAPIGAQPIAEDAAASSPRTSEGPVPPWAPEASPSDSSPIAPTAHISQEPEGSPPSRRSFRPLRWADPADARAWLDREGSHRRKRRVLSRAEIRSQRRAAERSLLALLAAADAGLTRPSPEAGERGA
jgi:hypothetical protein